MDLSEIPHEEWDYSVLQLAHLNSNKVCKLWRFIYIVSFMLASLFGYYFLQVMNYPWQFGLHLWSIPQS